MASFKKKQSEKAVEQRETARQTKVKKRAPTKTQTSVGELKLVDIPDFSSSATAIFAQARNDMAAQQQAEMERRARAASQTITFNTSWNSGVNIPQPRPALQMRFKPGDKVTVRTGKTVYRIVDYRVERRVDTMEDAVFYRLTEMATVQEGVSPIIARTEFEKDLKLYTKPVRKKSEVNFDSVVIEGEKRQQILEALEQVHQSELIFETWGFAETMEKGKGVSMLFYGQPGTGKTLMCQAIANKLGKKLVVVATADIESSAPGEAERNIRKAFKDAKEKDVVLLFDECDSLIYNRTNVGAILGAQINELLTQLERYDGVTMFTTNRLGTLDEAVNRRLALKLEFAMPSLEERVKIWQRMFPKDAPLEKDIEWEKLAGIEVTGGYIKNAVLRAARMAAIEKVSNNKKKITMKHLVKALRLETESMIEFEAARAKRQAGSVTVTNQDGLDPDTGRKVIHKVGATNGS